ncbi:unnamed protein product [Staurois parvus]|uniref:Uncharacterized protein n=1 Tax=Staurois parvus TaxID=386267 RepID=A0ABN9HC12_9NEOB|nr:unnamed protein product [Staurois parvus]
MGLVVWQQLEGRQIDTRALIADNVEQTGSPPKPNYKSHHASAFGSHACNCQPCNASWDL